MHKFLQDFTVFVFCQRCLITVATIMIRYICSYIHILVLIHSNASNSRFAFNQHQYSNYKSKGYRSTACICMHAQLYSKSQLHTLKRITKLMINPDAIQRYCQKWDIFPVLIFVNAKPKLQVSQN